MQDVRLGVDVGGTNTDAVVLDGSGRVLAKAKTPTTPDVTTGIVQAIDIVLAAGVPSEAISAAMLGTTQCINAILERQHLGRVGVVRLGAPATLAIPPLTDWSEDLQSLVAKAKYIVAGGFEFDGREISPLDEARLHMVGQELVGQVDAIALSAVFSPVNPEHERRAATILREAVGERIPISLSHEIGALGLLERENATILNAALIRVIQLAVEAFRSAVARHRIAADLFLTQNDGTLMALDYTLHYPILTVASGSTNSIRGAAYLTGLRDAVVVDVGGTTTDIGALQHGFPRQAAVAIAIGGVRTNFRMPELLSIGLGGGSIVRAESNRVSVGPRSVGYRLTTTARIFGGDTLTMTDIAVAAGMIRLGDPAQVRELLRSGARITVVSTSSLQDTDLICPVGGIGAPTISIERLPNGGEYLGAMRAVEAAWGRQVTHVSSIEIGGANALRPLVVAAQAGLPLVDGDGMGRAFPELQMCTFAIADLPITPIALQDVRGNSLLIRQVVSARWAEHIARAATVAMGGSAAMALFCLSASDYRRTAITGTVSLAARLGQVVRQARERHQDPVAAILALLPGQQLLTGKAVDVERRTAQGFARGRVVLASGSRRIGIDFQNEYLIARDLQTGEALATVPDLICLVHPETGEPLTTEVLRYGYQVAVIAIAAPGPLKSQEALTMVGPQAFGYSDPFRPLPGDLCAAATEERTA